FVEEREAAGEAGPGATPPHARELLEVSQGKGRHCDPSFHVLDSKGMIDTLGVFVEEREGSGEGTIPLHPSVFLSIPLHPSPTLSSLSIPLQPCHPSPSLSIPHRLSSSLSIPHHLSSCLPSPLLPFPPLSPSASNQISPTPQSPFPAWRYCWANGMAPPPPHRPTIHHPFLPLTSLLPPFPRRNQNPPVA
ncbi:unnamed protein product, partial [Closterium sp. Naga37s-1]